MRIFLIALGGIATLVAGSFAWNALCNREEEPERPDGKEAKAKEKSGAAKAKKEEKKKKKTESTAS